MLPEEIPEEGRLELGPAFRDVLQERVAAENDWPTYRHDRSRTGYTTAELGGDLSRKWEMKLPAAGSAALVVAGDRVYVAQIDQHTVARPRRQDRRVRLDLHGRRPGRLAADDWKGRLFCSARPTAGSTACGPATAH